jgi:hypothetical protein
MLTTRSHNTNYLETKVEAQIAVLYQMIAYSKGKA